MPDIEKNEDVELLVNTFYNKVQQNPVIGPFFNEVARVNWDIHLPRMYAFWRALLFGEAGFSGNPMAVHVHLNKQKALEAHHFEEWKKLFFETVDELFKGPVATLAKNKATQVASMILYKVEGSNNNPHFIQ